MRTVPRRDCCLWDTKPSPRRGLSRSEAAAYIGVSPSKFDELRKDGRVGPAKVIDARLVFDVRRLDESFEALPDENHDDGSEWTVVP